MQGYIDETFCTFTNLNYKTRDVLCEQLLNGFRNYYFTDLIFNSNYKTKNNVFTIGSYLNQLIFYKKSSAFWKSSKTISQKKLLKY